MQKIKRLPLSFYPWLLFNPTQVGTTQLGGGGRQGADLSAAISGGIMKNLKLTALALAIFALSACGQNSQDAALGTDGQNIVAGSTVEAQDAVAASTVALLFLTETFRGSMVSICTGTIVSKNVVLTAAHCLIGPSQGVVIFSTSVENAEGAQVVPITGGIVDPNYQASAKTNRSDVALVAFEGELPAGYKVARLAEKGETVQDGQQLILAGYGAEKMTNGQSEGSGVLRQTSVPVTKFDYSEAEMLFNQHEGSGACHGDSGGPAYTKDASGNLVVVGVTSTAATPEGGQTCTEGSLYEKVSVFSDFITAGIKQLETAQAAQ